MAKTQIADIVKPEPMFRDYAVERTAQKSRIVQSGMAQRADFLDQMASGPGSVFELPHWNDVTGASEILDDSSALTPSAITAEKEKAVKHYRGKAWEANDLAQALAGSDPFNAVLDQVGRYWARDYQTEILVPSLTGVFNGPLSSTHVNDIASEDFNNESNPDQFLVDSKAILDSMELLGDSWDQIAGIICHSAVYFRLVRLNLIEFEPLSEQGIQIARFLGREVIVDDNVKTEAGTTSGTKYSTYLFGEGAVAWGEGGEPSLPDEEAVETDRDSLAGDDIFITRRHTIFHPRGVKFTGSPAGVSPTKSELENGANWAKSFDDKNIPVIEMITNG